MSGNAGPDLANRKPCPRGIPIFFKVFSSSTVSISSAITIELSSLEKAFIALINQFII